MNYSAILFDEVIESYDKETKTIPKNFNEKKAFCKTQNLYILLAFLLITIALLITVCLYLLLSEISSKTKRFITISRHK